MVHRHERHQTFAALGTSDRCPATMTNGPLNIVWHGDNLASARPRIQILKPDRTKLGAEKSPDMGQGELSMSVLFPTIVDEEKRNFVVARSGEKSHWPTCYRRWHP